MTAAARPGRIWRVVVSVLVLASLMAADRGLRCANVGSSWAVDAGVASADVDGGDGDPGLWLAATVVPALRLTRAIPFGRAPRPEAPRRALVARHFDDCGLCSCSGTALPPPSSS